MSEASPRMAERLERPDFCVIGSGVAGALCAYILGRAGRTVVLLESGRRYPLEERMERYQRFLRLGLEDPWEYVDLARDAFVSEGRFRYPLNAARVKGVGGTTLHWFGISPRLHERDFKIRALYGVADDWPISYSDLEPYYAKAEAELGVAGEPDSPFGPPRSSGYPLPAFPPSWSDRLLAEGAKRAGIAVHNLPVAVTSEAYRGRPACAGFTTCIPMCPIRARYSADLHVEAAEATGNVTVLSGSTATRIDTASDGRATAVRYVDLEGRPREQRARIIILAAGAIESARLLLLSAGDRHPQGLANRSGMVGRYFMDHLNFIVSGRHREPTGQYRIGSWTTASHQFYSPTDPGRECGFALRFQNNAGLRPEWIAAASPKWGDPLEKEIETGFGDWLGMIAEIEHLPDPQSRVMLDPRNRDRFGNPIPRIHYKIGAREWQGARRALAVKREILSLAGATDVTKQIQLRHAFHQMGTCRMGADPDTSVVDASLRAHGCDNLFVVGSSVFVTCGAANPTLTIAALALRAAEYILWEKL